MVMPRPNKRSYGAQYIKLTKLSGVCVREREGEGEGWDLT